MKILLAGYFGCGNLGDEAILEACIKGIKKYLNDPQITVLSGNPHETSTCYKVDSINRDKIREFIRKLKECNVFILGGGGILQDITSKRSLYYYLALIWLAKWHRKKVILLGQSIGPIRSKFNRYLTRKVLNNVDLLTIRDNASIEEVRKLSLKCKNIHSTSDLSFTLPIPERSETNRLLEIEGIKFCKKYSIGVSLRKGIGRNISGWEDKIASTLDNISKQKNCQIVFLIFHYPHDLEIAQNVMAKMKETAHIILRQCKPSDMLGIVSKLDVLIGMRLHSLIFAAMAGVPMIGLSYDPKVSSFMSSISFPSIEIKDLTEDILNRNVAGILNDLDQRKISLMKGSSLQIKSAELNFTLLQNAIHKINTNILGIKVDNVTLEDAAQIAFDLIKSGKPNLITSANPEIILRSQNDMELRDILNNSSLSIPDGVGIMIASRLKRLHLKERVTGIDLMQNIIERSKISGSRIFLLGGKEGTAEKAASKLKIKYPGLNIAGVHQGYFKNDQLVIDQIKRADPDILFVGMGSPCQEKWSSRHIKDIGVPLVMVVGGSFDVLSGRLRRAPLFMRKLGMEWVFRLFQEPRRFFRILKLPVFLFKVFIE